MAETKEKATEEEPLVKAFMIRNSSYQGRLLLANTVAEIPRSLATELRDRNAARKPTKEELAQFKSVVNSPQFGEEPDDEEEK